MSKCAAIAQLRLWGFLHWRLVDDLVEAFGRLSANGGTPFDAVQTSLFDAVFPRPQLPELTRAQHQLR